MDFSKKIKKLRIDKGLTQKQIADALNVSQNAVYNWENGKREPNSNTVKKIAKILNVSPSYLMGWQDEDMEIELEIDSLIEQLENEDFNPIMLPETARKIDNLAEKQKSIESKISDIDRKDENLYISFEHFDSNEYSKSELKEIRDFAEFIKNRRITKQDKPITYVNAAHAIPGASEDDKQHDEDIMNDENF